MIFGSPIPRQLCTLDLGKILGQLIGQCEPGLGAEPQKIQQMYS